MGSDTQRATLKDIARQAGVGTATVDRVLNERGNVSVEVAERVLAAAKALNLRRVLPGSYRRTLRIEILLARPELPLIERMGLEFAKLAERVDRSVILQRTRLKTDAPDLMATHIERSQGDGIVLYAQSHPAIEAAINRATAAGKAVITIISDIPRSARLAYAGIDHRAAGRTAGFLISRMVGGGHLLVLCNHFSFQSHEARVGGLVAFLEQHAAGRFSIDVIEGRDDNDLSERRLRAALKSRPDTIAIYNAGAANRAVAGALADRNTQWPPIFIGHELTRFTRPMLQCGVMTMVIDQNPEQQARFALDVLMQHFGNAHMADIDPPYTCRVPFTIFGPEYLPTI
ncbi:MAG: LacI family DNA-binding transcriptional regulator [Geminicoccaceae bacterium]